VQVLPGIATDAAGLTSVALCPTGTLLYIPGSAEGALMWVARDGQVKPVTETRGLYDHALLSPDGSRIVLDIGPSYFADIWVHDIARDTRTRLTTDAQSFDPIWSADGMRVSFSSSRPGAQGLYQTLADGSGEVEPLVVASNSTPLPDSWSPDGRVLAYSNASDIWTLLRGGKAVAWLATPNTERHARFSPDGRSIAYVSNESGQLEVYLRAYPGPGGKVTISTGGGGEPVWSRDGRELFYRQGATMFAVPVETRPTFKAGTPRRLFEARFNMAGGGGHQHFDISPDGQRFLMVRRDQDMGPPRLNLILNWGEELKARVPVGR
jgi:Tol biopolymer transport system component